MKMPANVGLVLEGGGMRGVFTSGVLDAFMKYNITFDYVVAVSAGACNGISYMSNQPGRARISSIDFLDQYDYIGLKYLVSQGCIFDQKLLWDKLPNKVLPFDFQAYSENPTVFEMVTTNCITGRAMYLSEKKDKKRILDIVRASSSLPYIAKIVYVDNIPMLDGGIVDSIPVQRAIEKGYDQNVVVMTRNFGFRNNNKDYKIPRFIYKNYPRLRVALSHRIKVYNEQLDQVEQLEEKRRVFCIRPQQPMEVGRMEKDIVKLERLYQEGFLEGEKFCKRRLNFLFEHS